MSLRADIADRGGEGFSPLVFEASRVVDELRRPTTVVGVAVVGGRWRAREAGGLCVTGAILRARSTPSGGGVGGHAGIERGCGEIGAGIRLKVWCSREPKCFRSL